MIKQDEALERVDRSPGRELTKSEPTFKKSLLIASIVFAALILTNLGMVGYVMFRHLSKSKIYSAFMISRDCAEDIADKVIKLSLQPDGLNFNLLRKNQERLESYVRKHIAMSGYLFYVEVRDNFSNRIIAFVRSQRVVNGSGYHEDKIEFINQTDGEVPPGQEPMENPIVTVPVRIGGGREGEVRVGVSQQRIEEEIKSLRRELILKLSITIGISIILLFIAFLYVIKLLNKTRRLEAEAQTADRLAYVGTLASGLAHEIRNPLNAMNMNLQMLEEEIGEKSFDGSEEFNELLKGIKGEINRLERLVNNFLAYARPQKLNLSEGDINEAVSEVVRFLKPEIEQKKIDVNLNLDPYLPSVELDEHRIKQALMNILINAKQILKEGGIITVTTRMGSEGRVIVEIADNGPGMSQEMKNKVFDIFFSTRGGGTGLGLPIAQKIIESHGGKIDLWSERDHGTRFTIFLPRVHEKGR
ncbi:MAG: ATP-binding protein [Acidobacteriota bacterium]